MCTCEIENTHADIHTDAHRAWFISYLQLIFWHFGLIIWHFYKLKSRPTYWKLFLCLLKSLWEDGMAYQGVSMAIRVICQGPQSLGLERSWLISRMKKSAVWPVPSSPCSPHTHLFPFSNLASSLLLPLHPPTKSSISPPACLIPHLAIYTCVCKCHLFHPPLFSIYLIFLLCCHYALFLTFSLTLFAPPLFKALLTPLFSFSLITPLLPSTPHLYLIWCLHLSVCTGVSVYKTETCSP